MRDKVGNLVYNNRAPVITVTSPPTPYDSIGLLVIFSAVIHPGIITTKNHLDIFPNNLFKIFREQKSFVCPERCTDAQHVWSM